MLTYIFMLLQPIGDKLTLAFAATTHVEYAHTVVSRQVLGDAEGLEAATAQSVQI